MVDRKDIGSWLEGPNARTHGGGDYPGQRLGMPREGSGAIGRFGRRVLGVLIDWTLCTLIAFGVFGVPLPFTELAGARGWVVLVVFAVENLLLVGQSHHVFLGRRTDHHERDLLGILCKACFRCEQTRVLVK